MPRAPGQHIYTPGGYGVSHSKLQSPMTIQWLNENYEVSEGVSLPRSALYSHYLDFCEKNSLTPVNAASFGKIIRHNFPNLKTRRLGTRGQSKYHYYGITIKSTSPYHDTVVNAARQSSSGFPCRFSQTYSKIETDERVHSNTLSKSTHGSSSSPLASSGGTLLPDFPSATQLKIPEDVESEKAKTFLIMYRAHCQRVLDTILRANFGEVQNFLIHFWQGMPNHMLEILECKEVIDLIGVCDNILYKAISGVLIPGTLQPLPASLTQAIRQFAKQIGPWLESSLAHLPARLQQRKITVAKVFSHSLRRQTSLTHLAQAARTVLHSTESVQQMLCDWRNIDFEAIAHQAMWTFGKSQEEDRTRIKTFHQEFTQLLDQQATIDQYAEWASTLVDRCVTKLAETRDRPVKECAQEFLLKWSFFSTRIVRELTLHSAHSFGSFHLLHMLLEDYILYVVELQNNPEEQLALKIYPKPLNLEVRDATNEEPEPMDDDREIRPSCDRKMKIRRLGSTSGALLSPRDIPFKSTAHVPVIRSPSYRDISPKPLVSPNTVNNNNIVKTPQQDHGHFIYPPTPELSPRYSSYSNAAYAHSAGGYSSLYSSNVTSTSSALTDLDMTRNYGMERYSAQTASSFSPPRPKSSLGSGNYSYGTAPSSVQYDYRSLSTMDPMKYYSQYALPERNYQSSYILSPSVMAASNLYGYPRTDVVSGASNERYYPDGLEEFVDVQAAMHHGTSGRPLRNEYGYSSAILTS